MLDTPAQVAAAVAPTSRPQWNPEHPAPSGPGTDRPSYQGQKRGGRQPTTLTLGSGRGCDVGWEGLFGHGCQREGGGGGDLRDAGARNLPARVAVGGRVRCLLAIRVGTGRGGGGGGGGAHEAGLGGGVAGHGLAAGSVCRRRERAGRECGRVSCGRRGVNWQLAGRQHPWRSSWRSNSPIGPASHSQPPPIGILVPFTHQALRSSGA